MAKVESIGRSSPDCLNVDFMRSLVKQFSELVNNYSPYFLLYCLFYSYYDIHQFIFSLPCVICRANGLVHSSGRMLRQRRAMTPRVGTTFGCWQALCSHGESCTVQHTPSHLEDFIGNCTTFLNY